jgi:hypothetical protein
MIRWWHLVLFCVALVLAAAAFAPARFFLHPTKDGFVFQEARGSIWDATLTEARMGRLDAGNIGVKISPTDILFGRLVANIAFDGDNLAGNARLQMGLDGARRLTTADLRIIDFPIADRFALVGETRLANVDLTLGDRACLSAQGVLESDTLMRSAEVLGTNGPNLSGVAACEGPVGRLMLAGERDGDSAELVLDLAGSGAAQWSAIYRTGKPEVAGRLILLGFEPQGETGAFGKRGAAKWLPF